jgi:molybdopterin-guanine dinucleotide biosynthesis protein MobB
VPAALRVVGPPGSGKTLLIVSLVEALRSRGYRVATVVRREAIESTLIDADAARQLDAGAAATVIVLSNGGRVTLERSLALPGLNSVVASIDPSVDLILAEGFEDAGYPALELSPPGAPALVTGPDDLIAVVSSEEIAGAFATFGPGETGGIADLVEERLLATRPDVELELTVDERPVESLGFVSNMIARPVLAMVEQLKGVGVPKSVRLNIRRRRDE